ncbi:MAG: hypothetical protein JNL01_12060 [Bdellovibrionales bacterium]|nr:hypothetical protein [Bdellovibrionales bacterium]
MRLGFFLLLYFSSHSFADQPKNQILTFDLLLRPGEIRVFEVGFEPNVKESSPKDQDIAEIEWINFEKGFPQMAVHGVQEGVTEATLRTKDGSPIGLVTIVVRNSKARPRSELPETPVIRDYPEKRASEITLELAPTEKREFKLAFEPFFEPVIGNRRIVSVQFKSGIKDKTATRENILSIEGKKLGQTDLIVRSMDGALQMRLAITVKKKN